MFLRTKLHSVVISRSILYCTRKWQPDFCQLHSVKVSLVQNQLDLNLKIACDVKPHFPRYTLSSDCIYCHCYHEIINDASSINMYQVERRRLTCRNIIISTFIFKVLLSLCRWHTK